MYQNRIGNGSNYTNSHDLVATSIKLVKNVNGVSVLVDITGALEGNGSIGGTGVEHLEQLEQLEHLDLLD